MPYSGNPSTSYIDRLRLRLADIDSLEILDDATYEYFYTKNDSSENKAFRELLTLMLVALSRFTRERCADIEIYGNERFNNFYKAVKLTLEDPSLMSITITPWAGGISISDMKEKAQDSDTPNKMFYIGMTEGVPSYDQPKDGGCTVEDFYTV